MEIEFTNIDNIWVAEFEVTSDFNLHIERNTEGRLDIYQRTAGGEYEHIHNTGYLNNKAVYDNDFQALVYPKWIKIKSAVKPIIATITTDGEVNEVVYQTKEIEITSNGTTYVTADTGYAALANVNVKVNVPTEGGTTPTEPSNMKYYDCRSSLYKGKYFDYTILPNIEYCKTQINNELVICSGKYAYECDFYIEMICIDITKDFVKDFDVSDYVEITKEEFYAGTECLDFMVTLTEEEAHYLFDKLYPLWENCSEFAEEEPLNSWTSHVVKKINFPLHPYYLISQNWMTGMSELYGCLERTDSPFYINLATDSNGNWGVVAVEGIKMETLYFGNNGKNTEHGVSRVLLNDGTYRYGFTVMY